MRLPEEQRSTIRSDRGRNYVLVKPAILTTVTATGYVPSLLFVNDVNEKNLKKLFAFSEKVSFSFLVEALVAFTIAVTRYTVWRKIPDLETQNAGCEPKAK